MTKTAKISLLSFFTVLLIAALCLVLGSTPPLQALAARKTKYISEIRFAEESDIEASNAWLRNNGYTVVKSEVGSNYDGSVGVKYTTDPNDALTDVKLMNMKGGYSFAEYESFLEKEEALSKDLVDFLSGGIVELQSRKGTPSGLAARDMLNKFREDDSGEFLGDLLIDDIKINNPADKEILTKIFMQGNGAANLVIKNAVAIGCLDQGDKNWMEKASDFSAEKGGDLSAIKSDVSYQKNYGIQAGQILDSIRLIRKDLEFYQKWYADFKEQFKETGKPGKDADGKEIINITDAESKQMDEYIKESFKNNSIGYMNLSAMHSVLVSNKYKDNSLPANINNLADLVIYSDKLVASDLIPIAQYFTETQGKVVYATGISPFILNVENTQEHWDKVAKEVKNAKIDDDLQIASVYAGVDRSMFDKGGIAMTSDAIRQNLMSPESNPFLGNISQAAEIALFAAIAVSGAVAIGAAIWSFVSEVGWGFNYVAPGTTYYIIGHFGETVETAVNTSVSSVGGAAEVFPRIQTDTALMQEMYAKDIAYKLSASAKVFMAAMVVVTIIIIVFLAIEIASYYDQEMTRMPIAIVDNQYKDGKNNYIKYNALSFNNEHGELVPYDYNNGAGNQWQIIYATKDKRAGFPITEIQFTPFTDTYQASHKAVALFGETAARDLKKYGSMDTQYMYFKQDTNAYPTTGSVFNTGTFILTLCGGILGGASLGVLATYLFMKRKKAKNKAEPITYTTTSN